MVTLGVIVAAIAAFIASIFGAHAVGKATGKKVEKDAQEQKAAIEKTENLEAEKEAKVKSEQTSKVINDEIDSYQPGDASDWLRKNANRDSDGK